jgi:hypothetical protein
MQRASRLGKGRVVSRLGGTGLPVRLHLTTMTIVHTRPPKHQRRPKAPQPVLTAAIVTTRKRGSKPPTAELADDPEADARVKAWFARNVRPLGT